MKLKAAAKIHAKKLEQLHYLPCKKSLKHLKLATTPGRDTSSKLENSTS
jgi:hypothetical protein